MRCCTNEGYKKALNRGHPPFTETSKPQKHLESWLSPPHIISEKLIIFVKISVYDSMKTKYFLIYIGIGVAFLSASLWVLLSGGKNAKAIRAKYKLGGALLTTWALLSSATCHGPGPGPMVTCYEPVVTCYDVAVLNNDLCFSVKEKEGNEAKSGDVIVINITNPTYSAFRCKVFPGETLETPIQTVDFTVPAESGSSIDWEFKLSAGSFKGDATVVVYGVGKTDNGGEVEEAVGFNWKITIL